MYAPPPKRATAFRQSRRSVPENERSWLRQDLEKTKLDAQARGQLYILTTLESSCDPNAGEDRETRERRVVDGLLTRRAVRLRFVGDGYLGQSHDHV
jgi:hypothetical protein